MRAALMNRYQVSVEKDEVAASEPNALELSLEVLPGTVLEALCGRFTAVPERVCLELDVRRAAAQPLDHAGSDQEALDTAGRKSCRDKTLRCCTLIVGSTLDSILGNSALMHYQTNTGLEDPPYAIRLLGSDRHVSTHVPARIKGRCDPHTGMAHMPTTHTAKRWHCTVLMGDNELQLCLKPETCTRTTRQRHSLNWHCGVQMRDSGATALPDARET